ncbi:MAG: branched-chain amino acid ABC transporter substrate-binding protein [Bacillati bacterium ANGP1]|uniref:Branched-chain amino acid ABC transporter substrate-binding protein n=1 Tax=Candidatus Segetimicrobium genomatis TaxID=2569760 RepID=A0A537JXL9_9BACT|nr:MAG: branched-chain amino acid ABC transporter substrate-binding protein [Terrabacteria group bacterium ANGP1]
MRRVLVFLAVLVMAPGMMLGPAARDGVSAQAPVKVGVLLPLSGNAGAAGQASKAAIEVGAQVVNEAHPEMPALPLAAGAGLPRLGGARIQLVFADHQGNPSIGQSEALRLITQEHVVALQGAYQSSVTFAATTVAERNEIPWMVGDSSSPKITGRGFKWVFRTTPIGPDFAAAYAGFLADVNKMGHPVKTVAIVNENTEYGTSVGGGIHERMTKDGYQVVAQIPYNANGTDVSAEVLQLKEKNPDVVIFVSYTSDSILYMKTFKTLSYQPKMVIGDDSGFSDPSFVQSVGTIAQGAINRSAWSIGRPGSATYRINEMYKAKTGRDLDDTSGRNMQGFLVLADAVNRAGSTAPEAIRKALAETNLAPRQLMMGYKGVRFDATGQNILASTYITQLVGRDYVTIWPASAAQHALDWPFKGSQQ